MATMTVENYIDIGTGGIHHSSSWQFAKDKDFTKIIDESLKDTKNVKKWSSKLPKREEDKSSPNAEEYYTDLEELYGRVKIHVGETDSPWFVIGPRSQVLQRVLVTDHTQPEDAPDDKKEYMTTSHALGWTTRPPDVNFEDPTILGPKKPEEPEPEPEGPEEIQPPEQEEGDGMGGDPLPPPKEDGDESNEEDTEQQDDVLPE